MHILGGYFAANNFAVERSAFLASGGFDETLRFGEDRDFCHRWASAGGRFISTREALVRHHHRMNLAQFLCLHFKYGGGTAGFRSKVKERGAPRVVLSSPLWYANLVLHGVRTNPGLRGLTLSLLLAATQAASAAGFFLGAVHNRALLR